MWITCLAIVVVSALFGAGCGGETEAAEAVETVVVTQADEAPPPATGESAPSEGEDDDSQNTVAPDIIGKRLDVAESKLDELGIGYDEIGGGTFGVIVASNWVVCDQDPKPGRSSDSVKLVVARHGECGPAATVGGSDASSKRLPDVTGKRLDVAEAIPRQARHCVRGGWRRPLRDRGYVELGCV